MDVHRAATTPFRSRGRRTLADPVDAVDRPCPIDVEAGIRGLTLAVMAMGAVNLDVGPGPSLDVLVGASWMPGVTRHIEDRQMLHVGRNHGRGVDTEIIRAIGHEAVLTPIGDLVGTVDRMLLLARGQRRIGPVGPVEIARLRPDRGSPGLDVVVAVTGNALVGVREQVVVRGAGMPNPAVHIRVVPANRGRSTTQLQFGNPLAIDFGPDVLQTVPVDLAVAALTLDQQAGLGSHLSPGRFVRKGKRLGDDRAHREQNRGIHAVVGIPVLGGHAIRDVGHAVLGGVVGKQLAVQCERQPASVGQAHWILRIAEQVVLIQRRAIDLEGSGIDLTHCHLGTTKPRDLLLGRCRIDVSRRHEGRNHNRRQRRQIAAIGCWAIVRRHVER